MNHALVIIHVIFQDLLNTIYDIEFMLSQDLRTKILLFDGSMGTELQKYNPTKNDFPKNKQGFSDGLNITHPKWIQEIYHNYLKAGADCITTNTFGSNKIKLDEYGFGDQTVEINRNAAMLARKSADIFSDDKYVIGSIGPTGYLPSMKYSPEEQRSLDDVQNAFYLQVKGLVEGGVDGLILETGQDILEMKLALAAIKQVGGTDDMPVIASITFGMANKMLFGTQVDAAYVTLSGMGIDVFGINCSTGPEEMISSIQWLDENGDHPILVMPNAGIPDMDKSGEYPLKPVQMADVMSGMVRKCHNIRVIGGCCGTTPEHIRHLRTVIDNAS